MLLSTWKSDPLQSQINVLFHGHRVRGVFSERLIYGVCIELCPIFIRLGQYGLLGERVSMVFALRNNYKLQIPCRIWDL